MLFAENSTTSPRKRATLPKSKPSPQRWKTTTTPIHLRRCLSLAEPYYSSGFAGLAYLPPECRRGILSAGRVYHEIGGELTRKGQHRTADRVVVPFRRKAFLIAKSYITRPPWSSLKPAHDRALHLHFDGLVGTYSRVVKITTSPSPVRASPVSVLRCGSPLCPIRRAWC